MRCECPWEFDIEPKNGPDYVSDLRGDNGIPTPYKEITKQEWEELFWDEIGSYDPRCIEYRRVDMEWEDFGVRQKWHGTMRIFWFKDFALGVWLLGGKPRRWFRIGCSEYEELSNDEKKKLGFLPRSTENVFRCKETGHIIYYDSSD